MKTRLILFTLIVFSLASCQEKFSGASEVEFESSKAKVLKDLTAKEQENVEKALRVVVLYAMSERWSKSTEYTDKVFESQLQKFIQAINVDEMLKSGIDNYSKKYTLHRDWDLNYIEEDECEDQGKLTL